MPPPPMDVSHVEVRARGGVLMTRSPVIQVRACASAAVVICRHSGAVRREEAAEPDHARPAPNLCDSAAFCLLTREGI
jgi:hypothetical protein